MIRPVVPADRLLARVHYADTPTVERCPHPVRVRVDPLPGWNKSHGHRYRSGRCGKQRGHRGTCRPGPPDTAPQVTLCGLPMPDHELWTGFRLRLGDPICTGCAAQRRRLVR